MPASDKTGTQKITLQDGATIEINFDKKLGEGSFGAVYSGHYRSADGSISDENAAIKIPNEDNKDEALDKETAMNLIQGILYNQSKADGQLYIVMPNLGKPLQNVLPNGQNLGVTFVPEVTLESTTNIKTPSTNVKNTDTSMTDEPDGADTFVPIGQSVGSDSTFVPIDEPAGSDSTFVPIDEPAGSDSTFVSKGSENASVKKETSATEEQPNVGGLFGVSAERLAKARAEGAAALAQKEAGLLDIERPSLQLDFDSDDITLDFTHTMKMFDKMAAAVEQAHNNGILHLDIKGENFLYNKQTDTVKLIDFGVSQFIKDNPKQKCTGTPNFMAPELMLENPKGFYSTQQDIYSLGRAYTLSVANELKLMNSASISLTPPVPSSLLNAKVRPSMATYVNLQNFQFNNPRNFPEITAMNALVTLVNGMTAINPDKRPSLAEVRQQLNQINSQLKQERDVTNNYEKALSAVPFQNNKMADRFLAQSAIFDFNQKQLRAWEKEPVQTRGDKPIPLPVPDNDKLALMIAEIYEMQQQQKAEQRESRAPDQPAISVAKPAQPAVPAPEAATATPVQPAVSPAPEAAVPVATLEAITPEPAAPAVPRVAAVKPPDEPDEAIAPKVPAPEPTDDIAALALSVDVPATGPTFSSFRNSSALQASLPSTTQTNATSNAVQPVAPQAPLPDVNMKTVNDMINSIAKDVQAYRDTSFKQIGQQQASAFTPIKVMLQGDKREVFRMSSLLANDLEQLAKNSSITPEQKLSMLKTKLETTLRKHQEKNANRFSKGENSPLHQICKKNIDAINKLQTYEGPKNQGRNKI